MGARHWQPGEILVALRRDARRRGRPPRAKDWRKAAAGRPCAHTVWEAFGSWDAALAEAQLDPQGQGYWTRPRVVEALRAWTERHGRPPTIADWAASRRRYRQGHARPTAATVQRVWGSWSAALTAAQVPVQKSGGELWERCKRGHLLEGDNVRVDGRGRRRCLICVRARDRAAKRELRAQRVKQGVCDRCGRARDVAGRLRCSTCQPVPDRERRGRRQAASAAS